MKKTLRIVRIILLVLLAATFIIYDKIKTAEAEKNLMIAVEQRMKAEEQMERAERMNLRAEQSAAEAQRMQAEANRLLEELKKCRGY